MSLNAGPYLVRKARGYIPALLDRFKERFNYSWIQLFELRQPCKARKIQRSGDMNHGDDDRSVTTTASGSSPFKVELLQDNKLRNLYGGQFTSIVRCHILLFHSSSKKFKAYVGVQRVDENFAKYSLACTCNTGTRLTGCVHSTLIVYLFSHYLKLSQ